jgi:hypothetical protein
VTKCRFTDKNGRNLRFYRQKSRQIKKTILALPTKVMTKRRFTDKSGRKSRFYRQKSRLAKMPFWGVTDKSHDKTAFHRQKR